MRSRVWVALATATAVSVPFVLSSGGVATAAGGVLGAARDAAPVVLTGAQVTAWAAPPAEGLAQPQPSGASSDNPLGDELRSAHNGRIVVPPTPPGVTQVDPDQVAAYAWNGTAWNQIRVQVDQRFPYFLANGRSGFGFYSGTDEELTYSFAPDGHDAGDESWKKMFGDCTSRLGTLAEIKAAHEAGWLSYGPEETPESYLSSMQDPQPLFDGDDELSFMARDAGRRAPAGLALPNGAHDAQLVTVADPLDPATLRFVYLGVQPGGSSFTSADGYAQMSRDADSETWIDRYSFSPAALDKVGTSNTGYGPNLPGTVCSTAPDNDGHITAANGTPRPSSDREPRDTFTVQTPLYRLHATGRWLIQDLRVALPDQPAATTAAPSTSKPAGSVPDPGKIVAKAKALPKGSQNPAAGDAPAVYGPNIIARWKGRAFQQSPDSSISVVGFEDEQVNWEQNSALLGWRQGPVRAIREIWGADSGTNVTKTETYYRGADTYAYHVRVHPIPPDGLYTDWSYRAGVATTYYNVMQQAGVPVDGQPDSSVGEIDQVPVTGQDAEVNSCDPHFALCSAMNNPEEIAGKGFGLVYEFELTGATAAAGNVAAVPYYRDDACFDDGTGDAPTPRPWPGEASSDPRVQAGYLSYWQSFWDSHPEWQSFPRPAASTDLKCQPALAVHGDPMAAVGTPPWQIMPFSGAIGEHGVHFFVTQDSDNTFGPKNTDEVDGQQWRFAVPMAQPTNVLVPYGANVSAKLVATVTPNS